MDWVAEQKKCRLAKRYDGQEKQNLTERFNINSLWLDPSEDLKLIYNTVSEHISPIHRAHFARRKYALFLFCQGSLSFFGIFTGFPLDLICMRISLFLCSFQWFACLFYIIVFSRRKPLSLATLSKDHSWKICMAWIDRYSELWQIEKIISFWETKEEQEKE